MDSPVITGKVVFKTSVEGMVEIRRLIHATVNAYFSRCERTWEDTEIDVIIVERNPHPTTGYRTFGSCGRNITTSLFDHYSIKGDPKSFIEQHKVYHTNWGDMSLCITLDSYMFGADLNYEGIIKVVLHELIHVHQHSSGKLKKFYDYKTSISYNLWDNTQVVIRDGQHDYETYYNWPWEVHARTETDKFYEVVKNDVFKQLNIN